MSQRGLGCFTFTALISGIITLAIIAGVWLVSGGSMFSSGRLNAQTGVAVLGGVQSHAQLGGKCAACHASPVATKTMDEHCQDCHTDIPTQLKDVHSLHGILTNGKASFSCRECHTDHRGATASLTILQIKNFPHQQLGYSLQAHGKNQDGSNFECGGCHPNGISRFDITVCVSCHQTIDAVYMTRHVAAFGTGCLSCHDGVDAYGKNFNHGAVPFQLTGKHVNLDCGACHGGARSIADLKAKSQECNSCHAKDDAHAGQLGTNCGSCHSTDGWIPATFDHSTTPFPLVGLHATVPCQGCHINNQFAATPSDCYACHAKDDKHNGQFGTDCSLCHSPAGWLPASFDHSKSAFPLTGAHVILQCTQCHVNNVFKGTPTDCVACHKDPAYHQGLFGTKCDTCHSTSAWSPARFDRTHAFPISHGNAGSCRDCHPQTLSGWTCYSCHSEAEMSAKHTDAGISNFNDCIACHPFGRTGGD